MASFAFLTLLSLLFLHHNSLSNVNGDKELIQKTCQSTNYSQLCVSSLQSDPNSAQADVPGLAVIIVNKGLASSATTSSYAAALLRSAKDTSLKRVLKQCVDCYSNANLALNNSLQPLSSEDFDYAYLHVSAAIEYPGICRDIFKRNVRFTYPTDLGRREEDLKRLCEIALGIINLLFNSDSVPKSKNLT